MKRDPKNADGKKADVFSLAKTTWMLLSGDDRGFDGVYNFLDKSHSLRFMKKFKGVHTVELEELLTDSTNNNPALRPEINSFKQQLENWLDVLSDYEKSQSSDWKFLNKYLFGNNPPDSTIWKSTDRIINVLNIIGTMPAYNHMLFSGHGGLDFDRAELANEGGCIYIYDTCGFCSILKPKCLHYESFNEDYIWNYFLLELDKLTPIICDQLSFENEMLVEDYPAHYVSAKYAQYGVYDYDTGESLPTGYKIVYRYLYGKILIVLKNGPYNSMHATYDGRHGMCCNDEFRDYINSLLNMTNKLKSLGYDEYSILNSSKFSANPFDRNKTHETPFNQNNNKEGKKPTSFIKENFKTWCFKDLFGKHSDEKNIVFFITFEEDDQSYSSFYSDENLYLCSDGYIKRLDDDHFNEVYCIYNRNEAIAIKEQAREFINKKCTENAFDLQKLYKHYFSIHLKRAGKPIHLFTKSEIEDAMHNADDRQHNMLVIDESGYARIIQDTENGFLYPVRHESWNAGNVYVGKYSKLLTLDDDYIASLQGWLIYLKTGRHVYMDYVHDNKNEDELIKLISKYY